MTTCKAPKNCGAHDIFPRMKCCLTGAAWGRAFCALGTSRVLEACDRCGLERELEPMAASEIQS